MRRAGELSLFASRTAQATNASADAEVLFRGIFRMFRVSKWRAFEFNKIVIQLCYQ